MGYIGDEPRTYRRRLLATPEGTDLLIETLADLRRDAEPRKDYALAGRRPIDASTFTIGTSPQPVAVHPPTAPTPPRYTP